MATLIRQGSPFHGLVALSHTLPPNCGAAGTLRPQSCSVSAHHIPPPIPITQWLLRGRDHSSVRRGSLRGICAQKLDNQAGRLAARLMLLLSLRREPRNSSLEDLVP